MPGRKSNMVTVNHNYLKLPGSYLFSTIGKKVKAYKEANPQANVISLGIGDVTQPLAPAIIEALHKSVDEMGDAATFHGYAPDLGYEFLRSAIAKNDYKDRGCDIEADEIFVSDGAKSDSGNIQEIFGLDNKIAVCDPVYPVYVDTNVMAGRTGHTAGQSLSVAAAARHRGKALGGVGGIGLQRGQLVQFEQLEPLGCPVPPEPCLFLFVSQIGCSFLWRVWRIGSYF